LEIIKIKPYIAPLFGAIIAIPLLYLIVFALSNTDSLGEIKSLNIPVYALNTALLVLGVAFFVFLFGGTSAYLVSRFEFTGSKFFSVALMLPLAIPSYIVGYAYNGLFEYSGLLSQLFNTPVEFDILNIYGAIFIFAISMFPYLFIVAKSAFSNLSHSVVEVAQLQGVGAYKKFFQLFLPLVYPAFFIGIFLASMEVISDYGTVIYFGIETFSVGIFKQWFGYANLEGAVQVSIVLMLFVFVLLNVEAKAKEKTRYATTSFTAQKLQKQRLKGSQNLFASLFCTLLFFLSFLLPVSVLFYWSYLDFANIDMQIITNFFNTLSLNLISSFFIVSLAFIVLYFTLSYKTKLGAIAYKVSMLGYSIPGAVVGIGALLFFNQLDSFLGKLFFSGTFFVLVFAYLVRFYPAAIGSLNSGFSKITKELQEASKLYGKNERQRIFKIFFPIAKGSFISGFLIVFIDISKELPATLLLRPFNFDTLATRVYELASNEMLASVGFPSLLLLLITSIAVLLLNVRIFK